MNLEMLPLVIIGLKADLPVILHTLRILGCMQIDPISEVPEISARPLMLDRQTMRAQEEQNFLLARIEGLLNTLGRETHAENILIPEDYLAQAQLAVDTLTPLVQNLTARRESMEAELASLPRYEATLQKLLPLIPPEAHAPGNMIVGVLVSREHISILDSVGKQALEITGGQAKIAANDVDTATRAMLVIFPGEFADQIEALLGREDISRLRLPSELGEGPPDLLIKTIHRRMAAIPEELKAITQEQAALAEQWCNRLLGIYQALHDEVDANSVLSRFGETDLTFILTGWVPAGDLERLRNALKEKVSERVLVQVLPMTSELKKRAPVILKNPPTTQPFESLVRLLALPRYGHIDPTRLMAFFLPIFFGMILGDVGYGGILLLLSLALTFRLQKGVMRDIITMLVVGSVWAIVFGFLYGEAFGTLGEHLGMRPLWFDRASSEHVSALLLMSLMVGCVHITLGLILGLWEAIKDKSRSHLLERGGMLLGLISLFFLIAVLAGQLPVLFKTPAIVGLIIGIVLLGASLGWLGVLMGPIEFIGLIGNILSYLRIAAIGLASVYLAKVANDMVGMVGNLIVGAIMALLLHALNLVLGAFSPSIHSLRLHYVEFFRKFYEGGGRPFEPYRRLPEVDAKSSLGRPG